MTNIMASSNKCFRPKIVVEKKRNGTLKARSPTIAGHTITPLWRDSVRSRSCPTSDPGRRRRGIINETDFVPISRGVPGTFHLRRNTPSERYAASNPSLLETERRANAVPVRRYTFPRRYFPWSFAAPSGRSVRGTRIFSSTGIFTVGRTHATLAARRPAPLAWCLRAGGRVPDDQTTLQVRCSPPATDTSPGPDFFSHKN